MKIQTYGIHDQFSLSEGKNESLTVLESGGQTLAIDCPAHTLKSLHGDAELISKSVHTKIDHLFVSHTDSDHIGGIPQLLWMKKFGEGQKLNLITHPEIYDDLWNIMKLTGFRQNRTESSISLMSRDEYFNYSPLEFGDEIIIPDFGKIRSFYRSNIHNPDMKVMAISVYDLDDNNIANFSADTGFDSELIDFLYEGKGSVIHEAGSYTPESFSHTDISQLIQGVPERDHSRTFINHIPEMREQEILGTIGKNQSEIRLADSFSKTVSKNSRNIIEKPEIVFPGSFDPWTYGHHQVVLDYLKSNPYGIVDIVIAVNPSKNYLFSPEQRKSLIENSFSEDTKKNIKVTIYEGVIANYVYENKKSGILKGIRNSVDFDYEVNLTVASEKFSGQPVSIFIPQTKEAISSISSSMLKELMRLSGDVSQIAPSHITEAIRIKQDGVMLVGVTGSIASGKSTFCKDISQHSDIHHIDLDTLSDEIHTRTDLAIFHATRKILAKEFGEDILHDDGTTNKKILGEKVFNSKDNLDTLTRLMKEPTLYLLRQKISEIKDGIVLVESAILIDRNLTGLCDNNIINIEIDETLQKERLTKRNNLSQEQVEKRINSQLNNSQRNKKIHEVLTGESNRTCIAIDGSDYNTQTISAELFMKYNSLKDRFVK